MTKADMKLMLLHSRIVILESCRRRVNASRWKEQKIFWKIYGVDMTTSEFTTRTKTRIMYSLSSLGITIPAEAVAGVIAFYIVDIKNLPVAMYSTFWFFYTIYNALNNPALGYMSDRTRSRWGRRLPYILFGGLPYALAFALLFTAPFDG